MQEKTMYKYVFSDINRGVVTNLGCLHQIVNWIPVYVGWFAGCIVCGAFLQTATFAFNVVLIRGGGNIWVVHRKEEEDGYSVDSKDGKRCHHHNGLDDYDDSSQNPMKKKNMKTLILSACFTLILIGLDQLTKYMAVVGLKNKPAIPIIENV